MRLIWNIMRALFEFVIMILIAGVIGSLADLLPFSPNARSVIATILGIAVGGLAGPIIVTRAMDRALTWRNK